MRDTTFTAYLEHTLNQRKELVETLTVSKIKLNQDQINEVLKLIQLQAIGDSLRALAKKK